VAKRTFQAGVIDQTIDIFIQDSSSAVGAGLSGLVYNTASLACYYRIGATGTPTALSLVTQTVGGAHSDGGFVELDATHTKGMYRLDLSDVITGTAPYVTVYLYGATNMAPVVAELEIVAYNPFDATVLGLTGIATPTNITAGTITTVTNLTTYTGNTVQTGDAYARLGAPAGASVSADIAAVEANTVAINAKTTNLPASPAAVGSAMTLTSVYDYAKGTVAMTESYAANGTQPTPIQAMYAIHQYLMDFGISGTAYSVLKLDNATAAYTVALNSATAPTAASRT
jgi:hypothetical protein